MNVTELTINEKATITSLQNIDKKFVGRLMDLGIYESASILLLNKFPSSKLYIIEVDGVELCLREEDAVHIEVSI